MNKKCTLITATAFAFALFCLFEANVAASESWTHKNVTLTNKMGGQYITYDPLSKNSFQVLTTGGTFFANGVDVLDENNNLVPTKHITFPAGDVPYYGNFPLFPADADNSELWIPMHHSTTDPTIIYTLNTKTNVLSAITDGGDEAADSSYDGKHQEMNSLVKVGTSWYLRSYNSLHGRTSNTFITSTSTPVGTIWNPAGDSVIVTDYTNHLFYVVYTNSTDPVTQSRVVTLITNDDAGNYVRGTSLYVPSTGYLYILGSYNHLTVFKGNTVKKIFVIPEGMSNAESIGYSDKTQEVYIGGDYFGGFIQPIKGIKLLPEINVGIWITSLVYNSYDGQMYASDYTSHAVYVLSSANKVVATIPLDSNATPTSMTLNTNTHSLLMPASAGATGVVSVVTPVLQ